MRLSAPELGTVWAQTGRPPTDVASSALKSSDWGMFKPRPFVAFSVTSSSAPSSRDLRRYHDRGRFDLARPVTIQRALKSLAGSLPHQLAQAPPRAIPDRLERLPRETRLFEPVQMKARERLVDRPSAIHDFCRCL